MPRTGEDTTQLSAKRSLIDEPREWLVGGALALSLWMVTGILTLIAYFGCAAFWPRSINLTISAEGSLVLGQPLRERVGATLYDTGRSAEDDQPFRWVNDESPLNPSNPLNRLGKAAIVENELFGKTIGFLIEDAIDNSPPQATGADGGDELLWLAVCNHSQEVARTSATMTDPQNRDQLPVEFKDYLANEGFLPAQNIEPLALGEASLLFSIQNGRASPRVFFASPISILESEEAIQTVLRELRLVSLPRSQISSVQYPNQMTRSDKLRAYVSQWQRFLTKMPGKDHSGGMLPAIAGTIILTLLMIVCVIPCGLLAALFLQEVRTDSWLSKTLRLSIQNMAGVPSILFGVVGLTFLCRSTGAFIDGGPAQAGIVVWPPENWFRALLLDVALGSTAIICGLLSQIFRLNGYRRLFSTLACACGFGCVCLACALIIKSPYFHGFFSEGLPEATYGKGGIIWSALTLTLLTMPTVIVSAEEALASVPRTLRDGSLACGANIWQTLTRIVLPFAAPGIVTGIILAIARAVGTVAPLLLVGVVGSIEMLPTDSAFPYLAANQNFMHLSHQIYALGFEGSGGEAARPLLAATALLLVSVVASLNLTANYFRTRMRRRIDEDSL